MKPKKSPDKDRQKDLLRPELTKTIDPGHSHIRLSKVVDWEHMDEFFGKTFSSDNGRPAASTRLMVPLHYLKYTHDLSDDDVISSWVENPCWQYLSGMKFFEHEVSIRLSSMSRKRKRIGEAGAEELPKETIEAALRLKAVTPYQLKRVNVDTTVQEKDVRFPTDAPPYDRARQRLVDASKERGVDLRQNYNRKSRHLLARQSRHAHARQMNRAKNCTRKLRIFLVPVIRDIERKRRKPDSGLRSLSEIAKGIFQQKKKDDKIYSVHELDVECISKGKAHKRNEFGCKVSIAATNRGGWFVGGRAVHGNPYDGHTLKDALDQVERIAQCAEHAFLNMGYRGHGYCGQVEVHVDKRRRSRTAKSLRRWMKRRAAIEPGIGHFKREHRMDRNRLKGIEGDRINAVLRAAGMNFRELLRWAASLLRQIYAWFLSFQRAWTLDVKVINIVHR